MAAPWWHFPSTVMLIFVPVNTSFALSRILAQGDQLAMAMYAVAVKILIDSLQSHCPAVKQG